ncbi:MAG: ECF-type riboflavin transporter substrate-binding protein [Oscillospiraceae bacterium]|jgi:energy-coupling factor transport system substrate-specific component|nr:ECF-type riboflavin transporter substrate-binding protein [Oscillospiraceae bacterium]
MSEIKKKSFGATLLGEWNTQTIVGVALGAALFGVLMVYAGIPVFTNTKLTPSYIVPVIVGALFGPLPAGLAAFLGNVFADLLGGWGFWFDWSIGNFFIGFIVGLLPFYGAEIKKGVFGLKQAIIYAVLAIVGVAFSIGLVTPLLTLLFFGGELEITYAQAQAAVISDSSILIVVGLPILFALAARYRKRQGLKKEEN